MIVYSPQTIIKYHAHGQTRKTFTDYPEEFEQVQSE